MQALRTWRVRSNRSVFKIFAQKLILSPLLFAFSLVCFVYHRDKKQKGQALQVRTGDISLPRRPGLTFHHFLKTTVLSSRSPSPLMFLAMNALVLVLDVFFDAVARREIDIVIRQLFVDFERISRRFYLGHVSQPLERFARPALCISIFGDRRSVSCMTDGCSPTPPTRLSRSWRVPRERSPRKAWRGSEQAVGAQCNSECSCLCLSVLSRCEAGTRVRISDTIGASRNRRARPFSPFSPPV